MARFDVHSNPEGPGWLVDLQTDLLDGFNTRVVAPLLPPDRAQKPARG
jgi:toxin CcdB